MKSKVYTLTGDKGMTSLVGGRRVSKDDIRVEAYGTIDELNANLGMLAQAARPDDTETLGCLRRIQNKLFNIGAYLATENPDGDAPVYGVSEDDISELERRIDEMDAQLSPMRGFILPGGSHMSALCDVCRTVTRRAERRIIALAGQAPVNPLVMRYVNRLSDFFFILARFNNIINQFEEIYWDKNA